MSNPVSDTVKRKKWMIGLKKLPRKGIKSEININTYNLLNKVSLENKVFKSTIIAEAIEHYIKSSKFKQIYE